MPYAAPRICGLCGGVHRHGDLCAARILRDRERKARHDATRPSARERGYDSKWNRERTLFLKVNPTCRRCGAPATVVHHIIAHKGNMRLFWSRSNWEPACKPCHDGPIQAVEKARSGS